MASLQNSPSLYRILSPNSFPQGLEEAKTPLMEAAETGNIDALYYLLRQDANLLETVDKIPFVDTPLHIAASSGRIEFAMEILNLKASFARKLNQDGFSPMHLALKNNHKLLVLLLVDADSSLVRVKGRKGMTPLHFAAESGNSSILAEFFYACPESIKDVTNQGDTALHIAVKHEQFEAFEVLLGWLQRSTFDDARFWQKEILNWRNKQGDTVLHIAVLRGQREAVKKLFKFFDIDASIKNKRGWTAIDLIKESPTQFDDRLIGGYKIRRLILKAMSSPSATKISAKEFPELTYKEKLEIAYNRWKRQVSNDTLSALLVVDALIATMTYQGSLSPPGGVWQGTPNKNSPILNNIIHIDNTTTTSRQEANPSRYVGTTVMGSAAFSLFWSVNTYVFFVAIIRMHITSRNLHIFPPVTLLLFSCYLYSMSVISPTERWAKANFYLCFGVILASALRILHKAHQIRTEFKDGRSGRSRKPMRKREEWWQ